MALSPESVQALDRLRAFTPPPTQWLNCPLTRRAAVLILLFADNRGKLKVVLTIRSAHMRNFAGQAALPGGKADSLQETPWDTARREAYEEIGLPMDDEKLRGFSIEHLCQLPAHLSLTEISVLPCVAFLRPSVMALDGDGSASASSPSSPSASRSDTGSAEERLIPHLNPKEVSAVFTAPFHNFLRQNWEGDGPAPVQKNGRPEKWYQGAWVNWQESPWRMHNFYIPRPLTSPGQAGTRTVRNSSGGRGSSSSSGGSSENNNTANPPIPQDKSPRRPRPSTLDETAAFRVFGMTARILVDAARVAYAEEPQFEHNSHHGDEDMIARLLDMGRLREKTKKQQQQQSGQQSGQPAMRGNGRGRGQASKM